ncbi:ADP-ribosylation factor, partial [Thraustotheca clavata]
TKARRHRMVEFMSSTVLPMMEELTQRIMQEKPNDVKGSPIKSVETKRQNVGFLLQVVKSRLAGESNQESVLTSPLITHESYAIGDQVECRFKGRPKFVAGVVEAYDPKSTTYTIRYGNSKVEENIHPILLRRPNAEPENEPALNAIDKVKPSIPRTIDCVILLLGIDGSGKSTLLSTLQGDLDKDHGPSAGYTSVKFQLPNGSATFYDLGGASTFRDVWKEYYSDAHAVIYVVDAADSARMAEAASVLAQAMENPHLIGKPLLLMANKKDIPTAMGEKQFCREIQAGMYNNKKVLECIAKPSANANIVDDRLEAGLMWVVQRVEQDYDSLQQRVLTDRETKKKQDAEAWQAQRLRVAAFKEEKEREQMNKEDRSTHQFQPAKPPLPQESYSIKCSHCQTNDAVTKCSASKCYQTFQKTTQTLMQPTLDTFYAALLQSPPTKAALAQGKLSIGNKKFQLEKLYKKAPTPQPKVLRKIPQDTIDILLELQQPDGRWKLSSELQDCLYNVIPPTPVGVAEGMWATACALAVLRRHPEHYDRLEKACAVAVTHVDTIAFGNAKMQMPPVPLAIAPGVYIRGQTPALEPPVVYDADSISRTIVKDIAPTAKLLLAQGYKSDFDYGAANKKAFAPFQCGELVEASWRKQTKGILDAPTATLEWFPAIILYVHPKEALYDVQFQCPPHEKILRVPKQYVRRRGVSTQETAKTMLDHVRENWHIPVVIQDEINRFNTAVEVKHKRPEWSVPPISHQIGGSQLQKEIKRASSLASIAPMSLDDILQQSKPASVTPAEAKVVECILKYEALVGKLFNEVRTCSALYNKARIFATKIHAFDTFTQLVPKVVENTLECIELVNGIQLALEIPSAPYTPFLWHGRPFLSLVIHQFDTLRHQKDLVDWYGVNFYFERNPFMMTMTLGCLKKALSRDDVVKNSWWPESLYNPALLEAIALSEQHLLRHWQRSIDENSWV